jgi:tetratricopeptide (TPR) repeat protein
LALNPRDGAAYAALVDLEPRHSWQAREAIIARGLALAPNNPELVSRRAGVLAETGRMNEAAANGERAAELDPLSPQKAIDAAMYEAWTYDERGAEDMAERASRIWPDDGATGLFVILARGGDPRKALAALQNRSSGGAAMGPGWDALVKARISHDPSKVVAYTNLVLTRTLGYIDFAILNLENVGAMDAAFAVLARHPPGPDFDTTILFRPYAEGMRHDPRFMPLAARLGLVDYWRATNHWPDFCLPPQKTYDCKAAAALHGSLQSANSAAARPPGH